MFPASHPQASPRKWLLAGILAMALPASLSASILGESIIDDRTFFALIAETGFGYHVDGSLFGPDKSQYPNFVRDDLYDPVADPTFENAGPRNSYPWGMAWFGGQLYVGTNRNIHCTVGGGGDASDDEACTAGGVSTSAIPNDLWFAEIWRYTPSTKDAAGDFGLSGTWERVYRSLTIEDTWDVISFAWNAIESYGIPRTTPSDVGYRMLKTCDAGGTERLYVATYGLFGRVLYLDDDGTDFVPTAPTPDTTVSLSTLQTMAANPLDLGFRALTCFKGNLWTSPTGTGDDPDISYHPWIYRNLNPAGTGSDSGWIEVARFNTPAFDEDIEGIFQMEAIGNYLFVSAINRTTGWQLWRGTFTDTCNATSCPVDWVKIIDKGAGRPVDAYVTDSTGQQKPRVSNAVATLGVFQYDTDKFDLYMGVGESGYSEDGTTAAELLRIKDAHSGNTQWELLAGWPRKDYATLPNIYCQEKNRKDLLADETPISSGGRNSGNFPPGLLDDPGDADADDCFPDSGYGPGMGTISSTDLTPAYNSFGRENYFWRMAEHKHTLYVGTLGRASLWRIDYPLTDAVGDNPVYKLVFTGGLDDPNNAGVRSLVSTDLGLALGFTNPNFSAVDDSGKRTGGLEIYIASDLFPSDGRPGIPPVARAAVDSSTGVYDANEDGILDFFAPEGTSTVDIKLVDNGSYSPFGGDTITAYEWYEGNVSANCAALSPSPNTGTKFTFPTAVDANFAQKTFTLRVTAPTGTGGALLYGCDTVTVTATTNLPPTGGVYANVPLTPSSSGGGRPGGNAGIVNSGQINLIDFDGDGVAYYGLGAFCDGRGDDLKRCEWVADASRHNIDRESCLPGVSPTVCDFVTGANSKVGGGNFSGSTVVLEIEDEWGYMASYSLRVNVQAVGTNPVCRNVDLVTDQGVLLSLDPAEYLSDGSPVCIDGDLNPLTYAIRTQSPQGVAWADVTPNPGISYVPDVDFTGLDQFQFRASDGTNNSSDATIRVTVNPGPIQGCESGAKTIPPTTFKSGNTSRVAYDGSITTQGAVVVSAGANVSFESLILHLQPGFKVAVGGLFKGVTLGACSL